jgi:uncharacterized protein YcfJ
MFRRTSALIASLMVSGFASAGSGHYLEVPVVDVRPEYRIEHTPIEREVCWEEDHYQRIDRDRRSRTGTIVGAIIGGVIGNQFGSGNGRRAATVAGAALGGSIGRDVDRQNRAPDGYRLVTREQCRIERDYQEASVPAGYRVTYQYDGRLYHTRTLRHPGDTIRIEVSVRPVD